MNTLKAYTDNGKPDAAKAKKTLSDAGVATPVDLKLQYNGDHYGSSSADEYAAIKSQLEADGLFKVQITVDAKPFGIRQWWLILAVALVTAAAGIVLVVRPGESARTLMILMGVSLLAEGLLNLIVALSTGKILRGPDVIDVPYEDVQLHTEHSGKD